MSCLTGTQDESDGVHCVTVTAKTTHIFQALWMTCNIPYRNDDLHMRTSDLDHRM